MSASSPDATVTMVLDDICASSYCNLDAGGLCGGLLSEEVQEGGGNIDGDQYATPNPPGDGSGSPNEGDDVPPSGSSCDAGCIAAVTIPVSMVILVVLGATAYSIKKIRDEETAVEADLDAPIGMADDINDPLASSSSNDDEGQPLVATSAVVATADEDGASEYDDIVYVDQEEGSGDYGDEEAPEVDDEGEAPTGEDASNEREEDWG